MWNRSHFLKSKVEIGSGGVRMVGIWGIGGGGKTALATAVYMEIFPHFEVHCIIDNIHEESRKINGLRNLQGKLLENLLNIHVDVQSVILGKHKIKSMLCRSKVLVLLDDVDELKQLEALAGAHNWFGDGSRIIITTRDRHLLRRHRVDEVSTISLLSHDEAKQLFNQHAYHEDKPMEDYEALSLRVVSYAAGLPLAIIVLGSFLYDKDKSEWMSTLARLEDIPETEIMDKLKISYDGLKDVEKELFLDIACFYRRTKKDEAIEALDACGFHPGIGINVLIQKSLLSISNGMFDMHDLVQEMGVYIVRGEYPDNPEKHSRLWRTQEIADMCSGDATKDNDKIEAIRCRDGRSCFPEFVSNMKKLRFLYVVRSAYKFCEVSEGPKFLSNELRYIYWKEYPASPFPESFQSRKLAVLRLDGSLQKELWKGYKGNAIDQHFISFSLTDLELWKGFLRDQVWGKRFKLQLPHNWHNDFCGFTVSTVSRAFDLNITMNITQEADEDGQSEVCQEFNEACNPEYRSIYVGYVSFSSLKHIAWYNPACNMILLRLRSDYEHLIIAELGPKRCKGDPIQRKTAATDCSEFWEAPEDRKTFAIKGFSNSSKYFMASLLLGLIWHAHSHRSLNYSVVHGS